MQPTFLKSLIAIFFKLVPGLDLRSGRASACKQAVGEASGFHDFCLLQL